MIAATFFRSSPKPAKPVVNETGKENIKIIATFYPLAEFARQVGGDHVQVSSLIPSGVEPHDFEPKPQDIITLQSANIIIYNGANFEPWFEKIKAEIDSQSTSLIQATQDIPLIEGKDQEAYFDPHIWLDPILAQQIIDKITQALIQKDPNNANYYTANAAAYKQQLAQLGENYTTGIRSCQNTEIVTSHNAFAYLAKRYNFQIIPIAGLSPEEEPTPQKLAEIIQIIKQKDIKYIFYESLVSPRISDTIATEVGAKTLVFNPLEGLTDDQIQQGENYISVQNQNLQNLKTALQCSWTHQ